MPQRNQIVILIILAFLTVSVAVIPDIVSDDLKAWCLLHLGPNYSKYLIGLFIVGSVVLFGFTSDIRKGLFAAKGKSTAEPTKIPWSKATKQGLELAKKNIAAAKPEESIEALSNLKNVPLDE